mgnify:CR=1 FL=1
MSTSYPRVTRAFSALLLVTGTLFHVATASAESPATSPAPLSQQEIWKRAKFPWLYPTTTGQSNVESAPVLSQQEIWERAKFPWKFHTATVQSDAPSAPVLTQHEIWLRAKYHWLYPSSNR